MSSKRYAIPCSLLLAAALLLPAGALSSGAANAALAAQPRQPSANAQPAAAPSQDPASAAAAGRLMFIENVGQFDPAARFRVWGGGQTLWLAEAAIWLTQVAGSEVEGSRFDPPNPQLFDRLRAGSATFQPPTQQVVNLRLSFPGANPHPRLEHFARLETHVSYFIGADPTKWHADVPVWGGVRYADLYPGLDLEITGENGQWQWRLVENALSPGLSLEGQGGQAVRLRVEGAVVVAAEGDRLRVSTSAGELAVPLLRAEGLQVEGLQVEETNVEHLGAQAFEVTAPFTMTHANSQSAVQNPASRDVSSPQSGDLPYATFLGGSGEDRGSALALDAADRATVVGYTWSRNFPTTPGAFDTSFNGGSYDAFVVRLNATGIALDYATFLGGSGWDGTWALALDAAGRATVAGWTDSSNFPTTPGAFDTSFNGGTYDAFVARLNADGTALDYATFLGTSGYDVGRTLALDAAGRATVTGRTDSSDFPTTPGAFDTRYNGGDDAFVVRMNADGSALDYSTFLGGSGNDYIFALTLDAVGRAIVTGETSSSDLPTTPGAFDTGYNGERDAFVVWLNAAGSAIDYGTFLGGSRLDNAWALALDAAGRVTVTGGTASSNFPTTPGAFDTSLNGGSYDAFVVRLNAAGSTLDYSTLLGGSYSEAGYALALDAAGRAVVTGECSSSNFPTTPGAFDTSHNGLYDAFVVRLNAAGSALDYATFLGGSDQDLGYALALDAAGRAVVTGETHSGDFPTTPGAFDTGHNGGEDAFVVRLLVGPPVPPTPAATPTVTPTPTATPTATLTPTATPTATPARGRIRGIAWYDRDGNAARDAGEPGLTNTAIRLFAGGLQVGQTTTLGDGTYHFLALPAGRYTVRERQPAWLRWSTTPNEMTVDVPGGQQVEVDFGDWNGRPLWLPLITR